jgi:hypothetical protein
MPKIICLICLTSLLFSCRREDSSDQEDAKGSIEIVEIYSISDFLRERKINSLDENDDIVFLVSRKSDLGSIYFIGVSYEKHLIIHQFLNGEYCKSSKNVSKNDFSNLKLYFENIREESSSYEMGSLENPEDEFILIWRYDNKFVKISVNNGGKYVVDKLEDVLSSIWTNF